MIDIIKQNPLKAAGALASSIAAILGAFWTLDSHYASAADLQVVQQTFATQMSQNRADDLDDRIFMLQLKQNQQGGKLDPIDAAMLERYQRKLKGIQEEQVRQQREAIKK